MSTKNLTPTIPRSSLRAGAQMAPAAPMPGGEAPEVAGASPTTNPTTAEPAQATAESTSAYVTHQTGTPPEPIKGDLTPASSSAKEIVTVPHGPELAQSTEAAQFAELRERLQRGEEERAELRKHVERLYGEKIEELAEKNKITEAIRAETTQIVLASLQETVMGAIRAIAPELVQSATTGLLDPVCAAVWPLVEARLAETAGSAQKIIDTIKRSDFPILDPGAAPASAARPFPVVTFVQKRKHVQFAPYALSTGEISLRLNYDPAVGGSSEILIPDVGAKLVAFGYTVEIPDGFVRCLQSS